MRRDKLSCELRWKAFPVAISLVQALEEGELWGLKCFLIDNWLDASSEILILILAMCSENHIRRLE